MDLLLLVLKSGRSLDLQLLKRLGLVFSIDNYQLNRHKLKKVDLMGHWTRKHEPWREAIRRGDFVDVVIKAAASDHEISTNYNKSWLQG